MYIFVDMGYKKDEEDKKGPYGTCRGLRCSGRDALHVQRQPSHNGLSRAEGRKMLNNLVLLAMDSKRIKVIHGYRHEQALRDMIRDEYRHKKVAAIEADGTDPGVTFLRIA